MNMRRFLLGLAMAMAWALPSPAPAQVPDGTRIMTLAHAMNGGSDGVARVTFVTLAPNRAPEETRYAMAWKRYPAGSRYASKVLFFPELPATLKGSAYMGWLAPAGSGRADDEWLYLPELRQVRQLTHGEHEHAPEDPFARSVLKEADMTPRPPELDRHTLLRTERADGAIHFVVESVPRAPDPAFPYSRRLTWVHPLDNLPETVECYGPDGELVKRIEFHWRRVGDTWAWERVKAVDTATGTSTELTMRDAAIDTGLDDGVFTQRTMTQGPGRLFKTP